MGTACWKCKQGDYSGRRVANFHRCTINRPCMLEPKHQQKARSRPRLKFCSPKYGFLSRNRKHDLTVSMEMYSQFLRYAWCTKVKVIGNWCKVPRHRLIFIRKAYQLRGVLISAACVYSAHEDDKKVRLERDSYWIRVAFLAKRIPPLAQGGDQVPDRKLSPLLG